MTDWRKSVPSQPQIKSQERLNARPQGGVETSNFDFGELRAFGSLTVSGPASFHDTLSVIGGIKFGGALNVDGIIGADNATQSTSSGTGSLVVAGGVGIAKNLNVDGIVATTNTTASLSAGDGALVVAGGVGIGDDLNVADKVTCNELYVSTTITAVQSASCSDLTVTTGALEHSGTTAGFFGQTPASQPAAIADSTGTGDVVAQLNLLLAAMRTLGLIAT